MNRVKQAYVGARFFRNSFLHKWKLRPLWSNHLPALFFGCYYKQCHIAIRVKAPLIIVWIGSDALHALKHPDHYAPLLTRKDINHIALSSMVSATLQKINLPHKVIPITPFTYQEFQPLPLGERVYFYGPLKSPELYGVPAFEKLLPSLLKANIPYTWSSNHVYDREQMTEVYKHNFCNLRLTSHDGFPNTIVEMALMGRKSAWNGSAPGCTPWHSTDDLLNFIKTEMLRKEPCLETREEMLDYINIGTDWLYI